MEIVGPGKALRIYVGESDKWHNKPLYQAIVELVRERGLAGCTVTRGIEGFGGHSRIHTARILRLSEDLPVVIDVVDKADRIAAIAPELENMVGNGLVTIADVTITRYVTDRSEDR